jgi:hypothetical protein
MSLQEHATVNQKYDKDLDLEPFSLRDDSVTRRRILYPFSSLLKCSTFPWRNDVGYGDLERGSFLTYRRLPAEQDVTFAESTRARDAAKDRANFY